MAESPRDTSGRANCTGPVACLAPQPACLAPYTLSYTSVCFEGCVLQSECAGTDAATRAEETDGGNAKDGSAAACPTIALSGTTTSIGTSTAALLGWTDVSAPRYNVMKYTSTSTLMSVATTTATTYTDMTYYRGVLMSYFIDATIGTCTVASNEVRLP